MSSTASHTIYPRYCFDLSPTFNIWCLLRAKDIHGLDEHDGFKGQDFRFYKNLPIKWVRVVGVVVAIDTYKERRVFTIDDSSGACIEAAAKPKKATQTETLDAKVNHGTMSEADTSKTASLEAKAAWLSAAPNLSIPYAEITIGTVVDVKGCLSTTSWGEAQIQVEKMAAVPTTEHEVILWEKRDKFRKEVLDQPWVLRKSEIRKCQKRAEKGEEEAERKKKRVQGMIDRHQSTSAQKHGKSRGERVKSKKVSAAADANCFVELIRNGAEGQYGALGL